MTHNHSPLPRDLIFKSVNERPSLLARIAELESALRPFAEEGALWKGTIAPDKSICGEATMLNVGHLFAAAEALGKDATE